MKSKISLLLIGLFVHVATATAHSPMTTVLHKSRAASVSISQAEAAAMVQGYAACEPTAALPEKLLRPLGVKYLDSKAASAVRFAFPRLLKNRSVLLLVGNDPASMETTQDGRYLFYGGKYQLKNDVELGAEVKLRGVAEFVSVSEPRARIGITYRFDGAIQKALVQLESLHGVALRPMLDRSPSAKGSVADTWMTLGDDGKSATCWRFAD